METQIGKKVQEIIDNVIGRRVVINRGHPHAGETGTIIKFYPVVGITGKPGFEIKADEGDNFFVFSSNEVTYLTATKIKKLSELTDDEAQAELEWITEALGEGYTKKQLAKQYGCSVPTLNKFLRGGGI